MRAAHLARLIFVHQASAFSLKFEPLVPTDQSSNRNPSTCCCPASYCELMLDFVEHLNSFGHGLRGFIPGGTQDDAGPD
jgi:hypothetical protein